MLALLILLSLYEYLFLASSGYVQPVLNVIFYVFGLSLDKLKKMLSPSGNRTSECVIP